MAIISPVKYKNLEFHKYGVDDVTGDIWSFYGKTPKLLKTYNPIKRYGGWAWYPEINLVMPNKSWREKGRNKTFKVHWLVAYTLLKKPKHKGENLIINHKNHKKEDYRPINLEWITSSENSQKSVEFYNNIIPDKNISQPSSLESFFE